MPSIGCWAESEDGKGIERGVGAAVFANARYAIALGFLPTRPSPRKALSVRIPLLKF